MAPSLCENCHKRPKFGTHKFCGKTCAAQAATKPARSRQSQPQAKAGPGNAGYQRAAPPPHKAVQQLCIYCGQKPKFNGFDYCGKSCAALAGGTQAKPPAAQRAPMKQKTTRPLNAPPTKAPAPSPPKSRKAPGTKVSVPRDDSSEDAELEEEEDGGVVTDLDAYPSDSEPESEDEPAIAVPQLSANRTSRGGKSGGATPRTVPGVCTIPGCGQPAHVDRHGVKTMYCSLMHREEAVKLGLEAACIMCQRYPQGTSDYFCSPACRNQSMTKT